ncbi:uncharacterized protein [Littorina saxatilis]|uniref:uncharacterized protein n=1 Tax=Littorina saxatilis TaxID=31220 RepID=UPI0038B4DB8A
MNSGPETSSSEVCPLDSSLDTRGDYDASSSDLEDDDGGQANIAKPPSHSQAPYSYFVAAQRERYFQMYKDSGSEECDSPTSPLLPSTHTSTAQDMSASTGRYLPPHKRQNCGQGLSHFLQRRHIPSVNRNPTTSVNRNPTRRSYPPAVETAPGVSSDSGLSCASRNVQCGRGLMNTPPVDSSTNMVPSLGGCRRGVANPPDDSCSNTFTSPGGWWDNSRKNDTVVYNEDFPALGTSPSQASDLAVGSYASMAATTTNPQQPGSFRIIKEDGTCKTFFRKKPFIMVDSSSPLPLPASSCGRGVSPYSSRLLNDNRLTGSSRWGKEAKEAFFKQYQTPYVDTHCHLDFLFNREPYCGTFASYRDKKKHTFPANFEGCVAVFCNPKSFTNESKWKPIVEEPQVWMAMGCHPKSAVDYTEWAEIGLRKSLKHKKTVALGEIGLDYSKHHGQTAAKQKEVFIRQIKIALEMQLPLVIHSREAEDDCLEILEELVPSDYKIHCHCFTSNYNSALKWTSRFENLFIGLTPLVTYRSAVETHDVARNIPLNKLLLETDAPYFFPCGFDGEGLSLSHPGMALMVAVKVAELRNITVEEVLSHVRRNTHSMYGV